MSIDGPFGQRAEPNAIARTLGQRAVLALFVTITLALAFGYACASSTL
jgi:hypothetical protein